MTGRPIFFFSFTGHYSPFFLLLYAVASEMKRKIRPVFFLSLFIIYGAMNVIPICGLMAPYNEKKERIEVVTQLNRRCEWLAACQRNLISHRMWAEKEETYQRFSVLALISVITPFFYFLYSRINLLFLCDPRIKRK